jgi:ABC-type nitrate/sulfonate/bicarbonate transport system substrate-binding protein
MRSVFAVVVGWFFFVFMGETSLAEKIRVGFVSPAPGFSAPWIAKETGGFARHGLDADVILLTGSPRLVQSLIAGDVHYALVGAAAGPVLSVTRQYAQQNRDAVTRFMRAFVEAIHYFKKSPSGTIPILQKMMGGIGAESARILYEEYVELFEELPVPQETGLQAMLDQESDPKVKNFKPADFVDLSFLKQIDQDGVVEKIYCK